MDGPEVPPFFLCPISLQIMKDPVTIITGITFDRESIQSWFFSYKKTTCPVTKQILTDRSLTPNTTLLRLIESWRAANLSDARKEMIKDECLPTVDAETIKRLIHEAKISSSSTQAKSLRRIRSLVTQNESNKRLMEESGLAQMLASLLVENIDCPGSWNIVTSQLDSQMAGEEALRLLSLLHNLSPETATQLAKIGLIEAMSWVLQRGSYNARVHAAIILKSIFKLVHHDFFMDLSSELFDGIIEILKDQNSNQVTMAALSILIHVCPLGKNRIKAIQAGAVPAIIEFLAENNGRKKCEASLGVLELLCRTAEGRAAFVSHPASIAVVSRKIFRVSPVANDKAVRVLFLVAKYSPSSSPSLIEEMMEMGAVMKLCMVLQMEHQVNSKTKARAKEILSLHGSAWQASPCSSLHGFTSAFKADDELN